MSKKKNKTKTQKNATKKLIAATSAQANRRARRAKTEAPAATERENIEVEDVAVDPTDANEASEGDTIEGGTDAGDDTDADDETSDDATADDAERGGELAAQRKAKPELPPVGTVIEKRDRYGNVRCKCKVEENGIRYNRQLYSSISAAALAASKDLGLSNKTQNGYTFWGLTKPRRPAADRKEAVTRAWERYVSQMGAWVQEGGTGDDRSQVASTLNQHARKLDGYQKRVS